MRRQVRKNPDKIVKAYGRHVREMLGAHDDRQVWNFQMYAHKVRPKFKHMVGLWRAFFALAHILDSIKEVKAEQAAADVVQNMKALVQVALDRGCLDNAALLAPFQDPWGQEQFGGGAKEMQHCHCYNNGLKELATRLQPGRRGYDDREGHGEGDAGLKPKTHAQRMKATRQAKAAAVKAAAAAGTSATGAQQTD